MRHGIGCNIVDVANQLCFAYRSIAPKLKVFVSPPTESTRAADFIRALEEKQEVWHEMMSVPAVSSQYHNSFCRGLSFLILSLQTTSSKPVRNLFLLPDPELQTTGPATLATVRAVGKQQLQRPEAPTFIIFQAKLYALASAIPYK